MQYGAWFDISSFLLGASESIDLLAVTAAGFVERYPVNEMFALADKRLRLRCILTTPSSWAGESLRSNSTFYKNMYKDLTDNLNNWGWDVRLADRKPTSNCILIDNEKAIVADLTNKDRS